MRFNSNSKNNTGAHTRQRAKGWVFDGFGHHFLLRVFRLSRKTASSRHQQDQPEETKAGAMLQRDTKEAGPLE